MKRVSQSLVLMLLGGAVLRVSAFSNAYLNYVKPGFRPFLIAAGAVILVLGAIGLVKEWRRSAREASVRDAAEHAAQREGHEQGHEQGQHGHDHAHGPRVAWLLCLPVFALFLIAPPALGSFAAARVDTPPPQPPQVVGAYAPLKSGGPADMTVGEFIGRAWGDKTKSLQGKPVRLTGFVVPSKEKGQWYVTRMQLACCAADAFPLKVAVLGASAPPENSWAEVTGTWIPHKSAKVPLGTIAPELSASNVKRITAPAEPYE
ncbi:TIGR03943 family putative permease subunit [Streptosporangium sp. KLBMP 9127]|nr:TIGR03943 family protein [Streptosporangium sp. KLBMP 9127]